MIKTYRKTVTIQAEQFNGSDEMVNKYNVIIHSIGPFVLPTKFGNMYVSKGDWIATGINGEHWAIADDIFKKTYEEVTNDEA